MRRYFARSDEEHSTAMASISHRMNVSTALQLLEQHEQATPMLVQLARRTVTRRSASRRKIFLQKNPTGYGGFEPALNLLNSMLYESMKKYDTETAKCTDYYSKQCGMLEGIRGEIATSNYKAATCREKTLAAQTQIDLFQNNVPEMSEQLKQHQLKCKHEVHELGERLKIVLGDIEVLTKILEMTDCKQSSMLQLLKCQSNCSQKKFVAVDHEAMQKHLARLRSSVAIGLVQSGFSQLAGGSADEDDSEEEESDEDELKNVTTIDSTQPVPRTEVPDSPCDDPYQGAPTPTDKRAAKCTVEGSPECYKIQERFTLIQSGIQDERDNLKEDIAKMERKCKARKDNIEEQIKDAEQDLKDQQTKLADSMTCEANAAEDARLSNKEHGDATADLKEMMTTCTTNYQNFETELCGLRKIRGELYKMRGSGAPALFQDCKVGDWEPQECSKQCGGGVQKLTRSVAAQPQGGAKCLPLVEMKSCQDMPCPVDCQLESWDGWSKCSAECGGGVMQRLREVRRHMKFNGKPCGETSETKACNVQSCEAECELSDWTGWSKCSKACDGGTRKRQKFVKKQASGQGTCPGMWDNARLHYQDCNQQRCEVPANAVTLTCNAELDVVLVIDGSGSLGQEGWLASKKAAETFVSAFESKDAATPSMARMSVILFSGPNTWAGIKKCWGGDGATVDVENECNVKLVEHFTEKMADVKSKIADLAWPKGTTLTSLALSVAKTELDLGRKDAQSVVVIITDGRPMSYRRTWFAARDLRRKARLVWVPVTKFAPLRRIKKWATRRWQENVIQVKDFNELSSPEVVSRMIADICPMQG